MRLLANKDDHVDLLAHLELTNPVKQSSAHFDSGGGTFLKKNKTSCTGYAYQMNT